MTPSAHSSMLFKKGHSINLSIAVWQNVSEKAKKKATALSITIGSGYIYETMFKKDLEVTPICMLYGKCNMVGFA